MGLDLNTLISLPESGVAAFVNHLDRKVLLFHSSFLTDAIARYVRLIRLNEMNSVDIYEDRNKLTFELLETTDNPVALPVRLRYWRDQFVAKGYGLYKPVTGIKYRLRIDYDGESSKVLVTAINARFTPYIIGVFRNLGLAHQWVGNTFKDRNYIVPQYAANKLTE
jgi:hypothetical protein